MSKRYVGFEREIIWDASSKEKEIARFRTKKEALAWLHSWDGLGKKRRIEKDGKPL